MTILRFQKFRLNKDISVVIWVMGKDAVCNRGDLRDLIKSWDIRMRLLDT